MLEALRTMSVKSACLSMGLAPMVFTQKTRTATFKPTTTTKARSPFGGRIEKH
ncbi:MAG TPA: hypothetical protein P5186_20735 [Candidatus Paceibacterota bacterium]|nr:hypothetical protein [Verrucomicrobiota bacterium]HRY50484.1 hypothetical protein [Candidatus Paceibacterota bacterium]HSA02492.1 hypothetical protein [Candidatus Paceibacterota bacterium]